MSRASVRDVHEYTFADYIQAEEDTDLKLEFLDGDIYAMPGGTPLHARLTVQVSSALHAQLSGSDCRVYSGDLRVRVIATGMAAHPDVTVVCGGLELDPENEHTVSNPKVVVEVLSPSTEKFDRGTKSQHYRQIPSLGAIVLVGQRERRIVVCARRTDGAWETAASGPGDTAQIDAIGCTLSVDDVYA
jgi:Uma2 family endonuclease